MKIMLNDFENMKNNNFKIQVPSSLYSSKRYNKLDRFISYYHQIDFLLETKPDNVLEVGIGSKMVSNYIKETGINNYNL